MHPLPVSLYCLFGDPQWGSVSVSTAPPLGILENGVWYWTSVLWIPVINMHLPPISALFFLNHVPLSSNQNPARSLWVPSPRTTGQYCQTLQRQGEERNKNYPSLSLFFTLWFPLTISSLRGYQYRPALTAIHPLKPLIAWHNRDCAPVPVPQNMAPQLFSGTGWLYPRAC